MTKNLNYYSYIKLAEDIHVICNNLYLLGTGH